MNAVDPYRRGSRAAPRMDSRSIPRPSITERHRSVSRSKINAMRVFASPPSRGTPAAQDWRCADGSTADWETPSFALRGEEELCCPVESADGASVLPKAVEEARQTTNEKHASTRRQMKELATEAFTVLSLQTGHSIRECTKTVEECLFELGVDRTHRMLCELKSVEECIQAATVKLGKVMDVVVQEQGAVQQLFTLLGSAFITQHIRRHTCEEELRAVTATWDRKDAALDQAVSYVLAVVSEHTNWQIQQQQQREHEVSASQIEVPLRPSSVSTPQLANRKSEDTTSKTGRPPSSPQVRVRSAAPGPAAGRRRISSRSSFTVINADNSARPSSAKASIANASLLLPVVDQDFVGKCNGALNSLYSARAISREERSGNGCMAQFLHASGVARPHSASLSSHRVSLSGALRPSSVSHARLSMSSGIYNSPDVWGEPQGLLDCSCAEEGSEVLKSSVVAARWARKAQMQMLSVTPAARLRYVPPMEELELLRNVLSMGTCSSALLYDVERANGKLATGKRRVRANCEQLLQRTQSMRTELSKLRSWLSRLRDAGKPFLCNKDELMRVIRSFVNHQVHDALRVRVDQTPDAAVAGGIVAITDKIDVAVAAPEMDKVR